MGLQSLKYTQINPGTFWTRVVRSGDVHEFEYFEAENKIACLVFDLRNYIVNSIDYYIVYYRRDEEC